MKTNKLIAAALLPLLFSCAKENIEPSSQPENSGNYLTINVSPSNDAINKATFDDNDGISWQPNVTAGIISAERAYVLEESNPLESKNIYDYPVSDNSDIKSAQASFAFVLGNPDHYKGSFKFFYPYHKDARYTDENIPYLRIPFKVDPNQTSGVGKSSDNFAVVSEGMLQLDQENHDTPARTHYKVVGSYIRFLVYGKPGEIVKSISIKSAQKPSGLYFVKGETNDLNGEPYANEGDIVTVSVSGDYITPETISGAKGIYASVLPERALKNTYTVVTDKGLYEFESQKEAVFKFGYIMDVPLNLENAKCKYTPAELYIVGDACESGWDASKAVAMTKEGNIFTAELYLQKGEQGFKLLTRKGIFEYCYVNDGNGNMIYYNNPGDADKKFNVDGFALYKVTADFNTGKLTCEALAPYLVSDFTSYKIGQGQPLQMNPTGTPGVFKAEKVHIYNKSHQEGAETKYYTNAFKFAFKKTDGADIDYDFSIQPDNGENVMIVMCKEKHDNNGTAKVDALSQEFKTRLVGKLGNIGSLENNIDNKWMVEETYNNKYYDITLDLVNNKMTLSLSQGSTYKLVGINNIWNSNAPSATVDGNGLATWTLDVNTENKDWNGTFKICGENTISQNSSDDSFWEGEWYYSQLDAVGEWHWKSDKYDSYTPVLIEDIGDRKWKMTESGNYTIVFDTKNLTLKVTKNS